MIVCAYACVLTESSSGKDSYPDNQLHLGEEWDQVLGNYLSEVMTLGVRSSLVFKDEMQGGARHHFLTSELAFL